LKNHQERIIEEINEDDDDDEDELYNQGSFGESTGKAMNNRRSTGLNGGRQRKQ